MKDIIKTYPLLVSIFLGLMWATWLVAARKSGLSKNWINFSTVIFPAIIIIPPMIFGKASLERIPNFQAGFWIALCAVTCTIGFVLLREMMAMKDVAVSSYVPIAQTMTPAFVVVLSVLLNGEDVTPRKIIALVLACVAIYILRT